MMYHFRSMSRGGNYVPPDASTGLPWSQRPPQLPRFTCGLAPQTLVKFFAGLDIVKNALGGFVFLYLYLKLHSADKDDLREYYNKNQDMLEFIALPDWQQKGLIILMIILFSFAFIMSLILYQGAKTASYSKLRVWFLYQLIGLIIFSAVHVWTFIHGWLTPDLPRKLTGSCFLIFFLNYLWAGFSMYVTYLLMKDITFYVAVNNARTSNALRMYQQQQEFR